MSHTQDLKRRTLSFRNPAFFSFVICFGVAFALFLPYIIQDNGCFFFWADFNAQQIPFYRMAHDAVRAGEFGWNWYTDLGVNFIGTYSFYLLGSPFFWLIIPFPSACVPYLMAPLLMLKLAFAGLGAHLYLSRFVKAEYATIGAILYAFSSFSFYNLFYNHFHEAMLYLPFILYALERRMGEGKRGWFGLLLCLSALNNYYFFIGQAIFLLIYWGVRLWSGAWKITAKNIVGTIIEAVLGTAGAGLLLLPSFFAVIQNPRAGELISGWDTLVYKTPRLSWGTLFAFFVPPGTAGYNTFCDDQMWSAPTLWVPLFGCTGLIAYLQSRKHTDWLRRLWVILILCLFVPVLNQAFSLFNSFYYARWHYMPTLMLILASLLTLDQEETHPINWKRAFWWSGGITAALAVFLLILPLDPDPYKSFHNLIGNETVLYTVLFLIAGGSLLALGKLLSERKKSAKAFRRYTLSFCIVFALFLGYVTIGNGHAAGALKVGGFDDFAKRYVQKTYVAPLPSEDETFYRVDAPLNYGIFHEKPCIDTFNSIVPGSIVEFYNSMNIDRAMKSVADSSHYALRSLLSTRYALETDGLIYENDIHNLRGFEKADAADGWTVYENANFIPMGFTYDSYITQSEYNALPEQERELALLRSLVVEDEDADTVSARLPHGNVAAEFTYETFVNDCAARRKSASSDFAVTKHGFTATISTQNDNMAFFSVPFENGWSATVNGKPTKILKTNVGFMSVAVPAGTSEITFTYKTPGLFHGAMISLAAWLLLALYLWLEPRLFKKSAKQN